MKKVKLIYACLSLVAVASISMNSYGRTQLIAADGDKALYGNSEGTKFCCKDTSTRSCAAKDC